MKVYTDVRVVLERLDITPEQTIGCKIPFLKHDSREQEGVDLTNNNVACDDSDSDAKCNRSIEEKIEFFKDIQIQERWCCENSKVLTPVRQLKEACKILKMGDSMQIQRVSKILKLVKIVRPREAALQEIPVIDDANSTSHNSEQSEIEDKTLPEKMTCAKETKNNSDLSNEKIEEKNIENGASNSEAKTVDEPGVENNHSEVHTVDQSKVQKKQCDYLKVQNTTNETGNVVGSEVKTKTNSSSKKSHTDISDQPKMEATKKIHRTENEVSRKEKSTHSQESIDKKTEIVRNMFLNGTEVNSLDNQNKGAPNHYGKRSSSSSSKDKNTEESTNKKYKADENVKQRASCGNVKSKHKDRNSTSESCSW
uniref:Uncharacterized protein n=3 Tax=Cacopsylla melanoneura TaxID=428564 RepID=A0A8D8UW98_9HEMI